ncbi:MAG TPA: hypothetical protein VH575_34745 [Gemmataceae bacterium]|jgi:hypothetical protein
MGRVSILWLVELSFLLGTAGCTLCRHSTETPCSAATAEPSLPAVERTALEPDLLESAASVKPAQPPGDPQSTLSYRVLAPQQCQCLAAQHAPLADSLDYQRRKLQEGANNSHLCERKSDKQRAFQEAILLYSALEIRDQSAGTALEWYYQLAGAEAKADLLNTSLDRARDTLSRIERLKKQGIRLPSPIEEYQRQIVQLQLQQAQNQLTIEQLNSKLRQAMKFDSAHRERFRPDARVPLSTETVPNVEAAVHLGLAQRPQLLLLRAMIDDLDRDTLGAARSLLQSINPLLAMSSPVNCKPLAMLGKLLHIQPGQNAEVERVRAQLTDYLHERERVVAAEIREAAYEVRARRESVVLAREAAGRWQDRIKDLEKQQAQGMPVFAELTSAHMDWYKARGEVVKEFLGWKIAAVKVKQAQGILPAECGYTNEDACGSCAACFAAP